MDQRDQQELEAQTLARGRLIQIFRYLQALNQWRNPPQREISEPMLVHWFHDLPTHPCIVSGKVSSVNEDANDDFILKVARPQLTEAPPPPGGLRSWVQEGWMSCQEMLRMRGSGDNSLMS